jgi:predicted DNA-binding protein (UPF0251 family)
MPRPLNTRKIEAGLEGRVLKPQGTPMSGLDRVRLALDGLEAIRLADLEGLYQEEAASRMGVSRATFARVLAAARRTVADALVNGKAVEIGGGTVERRPSGRWPCPVHGGRQRRGRGCHCGGDSEAQGHRRGQRGQRSSRL